MEIAQGIHRMGSRYVNWYLIEEGGKFTVLDTGLSAYWEQLPAALAGLGKSLTDVDAVVLTHNHTDHVANAERVRKEAGCVVWISLEDRPVAHGDIRSKMAPGIRSNLWRPPMMRYFVHVLRHGGAKYPTVSELSTFSEGEVLDIPGSPRVVRTPGHTSGHCALLMEARGVVFTGDGLVTLNVATGETGPRLLSINDDRDQAWASLAQLEALRAETVLPCHGEPFRDGIAEAVRQARRR